MVTIYLKLDLLKVQEEVWLPSLEAAYVQQTYNGRDFDVYVPSMTCYGGVNEQIWNSDGTKNAVPVVSYEAGDKFYTMGFRAEITGHTFDPSKIVRDEDIPIHHIEEELPRSDDILYVGSRDFVWRAFTYENYLYSDDSDKIILSRIDLREYDVINLYSSEGGDDQIELPRDGFDFKNGLSWESERIFDAGEGDDFVKGSGGDDNINGGMGVFKDYLFGSTGNDRLDGGLGSDVIDGGKDVDTAVFTGSVDDYIIKYTGEVGIIVKQKGIQTDHLANIELLSFDDTLIDSYACLDFSSEDVLSLALKMRAVENAKLALVDVRTDLNEIIRDGFQDVTDAKGWKNFAVVLEVALGKWNGVLAAVVETFQKDIERINAPPHHRAEAAIEELKSAGSVVLELATEKVEPRYEFLLELVSTFIDIKGWKESADEIKEMENDMKLAQKTVYKEILKFKEEVAQLERLIVDSAELVDDICRNDDGHRHNNSLNEWRDVAFLV
jgi:hypothetical protein